MPVPYIIALIIGVIVVVVLAYWLVSAGGKGSNIGKEAECTARKVEYCASQTDDAWQKISDVCGSKLFGEDKTITKNNKPITIGACYSYCSTIIPGWKSINNKPGCSPPQS